MPQLPISSSVLRVGRERAGLSGRGLGRRVAQRLGDPSRAKPLSLVFSRIESGSTNSAYVEPRVLDALAAELALTPTDLSGPSAILLWEFRTPEGRPAELGLAMPVWSAPEAAYEARGILTGANGAMPDVLADAALAPSFAHDREQWLAESFDVLDDPERAFVLPVDPDERTLRTLWLLHIVITSTKPAARRRVLIALRDFADAGTLPAVDLDLLYDLAARRLRCDRLRDAPVATWDRWREHEHNLAEAVHVALRLDANRLAEDVT